MRAKRALRGDLAWLIREWKAWFEVASGSGYCMCFKCDLHVVAALVGGRSYVSSLSCIGVRLGFPGVRGVPLARVLRC